MGHSGYSKDKTIAKNVPDVDVVVGGHSHSFLYTVTSDSPLPSIEEPEGPYPTYVMQSGTKKIVPVLQAYAYTKYLGYMNLTFDDTGNLIKFIGKPILLSSKMLQGILLVYFFSQCGFFKTFQIIVLLKR